MPINPTDAKKMAKEFNTLDLKSMIEKNDELMRMVMEAGDMEAAEKAAEDSAKASAALIVRKNDVRELAKRVRERVEQDASVQETAPATPQTEPIAISTLGASTVESPKVTASSTE